MLKIFASHALDIINYGKEGRVEKKKAGPGYFIENVLNSNKIIFKNYLKNSGKVSINVTSQGEFGKIEKTPNVIKYPKINKNEFIIISTLLSEVNLEKFVGCENVCLDLQGYVRKTNGNTIPN